jgi:hypothetical protein
VDGDLAFNLPIPVPDAGYRSVTLALTPPCPQIFTPTLECDSVRVNNLALGEFMPSSLDAPIQFEHGVELASAHLEHEDETVSAWLLWRFDQPRTELDVRFVHILDSEGNLVGQADGTLGDHPAGSQWVESLDISANLPAGIYNVYAGWYTYPATTRFAALSDIPGRENGLALIGTLNIE